MIPKIIHQVWEGQDGPMPSLLKELSNTWKAHHPTWQYEFWNEERMTTFVKNNYPEFWDIYLSFPYDVQRWDSIRYLILYKIGGLYVDVDYECLENIELLLADRSCCFAMEPDAHAKLFNKTIVFNNALMASIPEHLFIKKVIEKVFSENRFQNDMSNKMTYVLNTTGPWMLEEIYNKFENKDNIYLIPAKYVSPFTKMEARAIIEGASSEVLENKLKEACAVHYFLGLWV